MSNLSPRRWSRLQLVDSALIGRDSLDPINADEAPSRHIARLVRRALRLAVVQKALLAKWS
jgi:hypothetical protein